MILDFQIRLLHAGKLPVDRCSQNPFSGLGQFEYSYAEKVGGFQIYFFSSTKRGSAEEGEGKKGCEQESDVWGEIKSKLRKGKGVARGL